MSLGADPQMTLRDYFTRFTGFEHTVIVNIAGPSIEFYVRPVDLEEKDGMHFTVDGEGKISEVGVWVATDKEIEREAETNPNGK